MNRYTIKIKIYSFLKELMGKKRLKKIEVTFYSEIAKRSGVHFFHIPKSAGTSICKLLYGRRIGHNAYQDILDIKGEKYLSNIETFTVVREPLDRIISSYKFARFGSKSGDVKKRSFYFNDKRFRNIDSFIQEWLVHENLDTVDLLFRPQYKFVVDENGNIPLNKTFKIENPKNIEKYLSNYSKTEVVLPHLNQTNSRNGTIKMSNRSKKIIEDLYKDDFIKFEY